MTARARDYRDNVIEALADDEAAAIRYAADVETERDQYRTMVQILLEQTHEQAAVIEHQRETIARDRDAHRQLRAAILRPDAERVA